MDTITPISALIVVVLVTFVANIIVYRRKKREQKMFVPTDINHYFDPLTGETHPVYYP